MPTSLHLARLAITLTLTLSTIGTSRAAEISFPADTGMINVKDYGAKGDGRTDDTAAINKAIAENIKEHRYRCNPFIYFPKGTYIVSGPIEGRTQEPGRDEGKAWSAGWMSMMLLLGESREGTVIQLKDRAPGYNDLKKPKWVIATGSESDKRDNFSGGGNRAFRHTIQNLTVDVGNGNPGAIGIDFIASNRGSIDGVTIRSGKDSGSTGINLTRNWPGPAMIMDVTIEGFASGIALNHYQYGMTFENIQMTGQREIGVSNNQNVVTMRKVRFEGKVPFYKSDSGHSLLCLLDSTLTGPGTGAAITSKGLLNLQRVTVGGYDLVVDDTSKADQDLPATADKPTVVAVHNQGPTLNAAGGTAEWLNLPVEDIPSITYPTADGWTDGGTTGESIQAAIDSGEECIFISPAQKNQLNQTLDVSGKKRLIMGLSGYLVAPKDGRAVRIEDGDAPVVIFQHMYLEGGVEQASKRSFALIHGDMGGLAGVRNGQAVSGFYATGPGKSFIVDVIGRNYQIGPQHTFWARQLNAEFGSDPLFTNSGTSWILGFKMETSSAGSKDAPLSTPSILNKRGKVEVIGGLLYTLGNGKAQAPKVPAFTNESGSLAVSYRTNGKPATYYPVILRMGSFTGGKDLPASVIKGPGAALLTDQR